MKMIVLDDVKYNVIVNYKEGFDKEEVENKYTDFFKDYDYILGDWAYGKLRLKGFCKKGNPLFKDINDYNKKDEYLKNNCAFNCKYFILEKE